MTAPPRPTPVDPFDARFWSFVHDHGELRVQRCTACGTFRHPPRPVCAQCGSAADDWERTRGGAVWSFTVIHPPTLPAFADRTPYGAVVVRLDEGVFFVSRLVDCPLDELEIGMRVEPVITDEGDGVVLPLFRRA